MILGMSFLSRNLSKTFGAQEDKKATTGPSSYMLYLFSFIILH